MFKTQINRLLLAVVLFNLCAVVGCHRGYYRRQADAEAQRLIRQKAVDPRWNTATGNIDIDPQSRMFDPFSSDHPPIPPDDATSHQLMHCVDGKQGYPQWNANGDTNFVENPEWRNYLPYNEEGQVVLTLDRAYQLALIHSPELQEAREILYQSALDVSLDRFGFDSQLFAGYNSFFTTRGRFRGSREGDPNPSSSSTIQNQLGANGGGITLERLGTTGTSFVVGLANTILFNFSGNGTQSASSLVDFSIIQPLLRGAGRDRIMESLTQSERTLLANVRQLERFRRGFYLQIAVGRNIAARLNLAGNFLGIPGNASRNAAGYFGLLEQQQQIRNQELNVRQLENVLELFREFFLRERLDAVQLKSFETDVYSEQRRLLDLRIDYQTQLDLFKRTLGLPPDLDVVIEDSYLDRFKLISDEVNERLILSSALRKETGSVLNGVDNLFDDLNSVDDIDTGVFVWPTDLAEQISELIPYMEQAESTLEMVVAEDRVQLEQDFDVLDRKREARLAYLNKLKTAIESGQINSPVDPGLFETDSLPETGELRAILSDLDSKDSILSRAARVKQELSDIKTKIAQFKQTENVLSKKELYEYLLNEFQEKIPGQLSEINNLVLEISLLQARTRSNSIEIIDVDILDTQAIEIARCMRRDWMNARASHVDNWRNIEFVADQLEAQVDLVFEGDIGNTGDNPFRLRYETGQLRAGFRFDAPIVRMAERNNYRRALISYQQSRRDFYDFEDAIKRNLRFIMRDINRNKVLFELERRQVQTSIESVEINRYDLEAPVRSGNTSRLGPTAAQQLARAIIGLNSSQNRFLGSWIGYEVLRRNLDFDMGTMQLDSRFDWVDPGQIDASIGQRAAAAMGVTLDCQFCEGVAAPGGYAVDLISAPASSVMEPQPNSLQFESEIPVPAEIERIEGSSAPQLNQPKSGLRQRRSFSSGTSAIKTPAASRVPGFLFSPVYSDSELAVPKPTNAQLKQNQVQAKRDAVAIETVIDSIKNSSAAISKSSSALASPRSSSPNSGVQSAQARNEINSAYPPMRADRIADKFAIPPVKQTSSIGPAIKERSGASPPLVESEDTPRTTGQTLTKGVQSSSPVELTGATELTPVAAKEPSLTNNSESETRLPGSTSWQTRPSSLGGVLSRFRTVPEKK